MRWTVLGVVVLMLLAGCGGQGSGAQSPSSALPLESTTAPTAACTSDGVAFSLGGTDAAMGVRVLGVKITNCGDEPVTVDGYPDLRLFDEEREQLDVAVVHGSTAVATVPALDVPPTPVVLEPGESAWAGMVWRNLVTDPTVKATTAVGLDVALSQETDWHDVPMVHTDEWGAINPTTIDLGNTDTIGVGPWQRPRQGQTDGPSEPADPTHPPTDDRRARS